MFSAERSTTIDRTETITKRRFTEFYLRKQGLFFICPFLFYSLSPVSEFNEFEPRLKSAKNRFQFSAGLNLEILNTILSETNHI